MGSRQRVSPEKRLFVIWVQARLCTLRYKRLQRKREDIENGLLWGKRGNLACLVAFRMG